MTSFATVHPVPARNLSCWGPRLWVTALAVGLFASLPREAAACDPNCDQFGVLILGTPAALGTVLVAPLVGLATDRRPNRPYWQALGFTTLAAGAGWGVGMAVTSPTDDQVREAGLVALAALPVLLGSAATYLTYRFWPRPEGATSRASRRRSPMIGVTPTPNGISFGASVRL
jgi:hypothetical protein